MDRLNKKNQSIQEDPLQYLWAISYSDLLMLLVCFFLIYYNTKEIPEVTPLKEVMLGLEKEFGKSWGDSVDQNSNRSPASENNGAQTELLGEIENINLKPISENGLVKGILINFPDNIYPIGGYELDKDSEKVIAKVLGIVKKKSDHFNIVFIGHSDLVPFQTNNKVVNNNLILSSLRAAKGVEYAIAQGFDPFWVSAQGMSEHVRGSRSLSIRVMQKEQFKEGIFP